jgi:hypothetical protein
MSRVKNSKSFVLDQQKGAGIIADHHGVKLKFVRNVVVKELLSFEAADRL